MTNIQPLICAKCKFETNNQFKCKQCDRCCCIHHKIKDQCTACVVWNTPIKVKVLEDKT